MAYSTDETYIIVTYHYVQDPSREWGGIYPVSRMEFERQVAFLSSKYCIASVADVYRAAKEKSGERVCAITFDDGTKDQYENALPILEAHNAFGTFFLITGVFEELVPYTHRMHIALSRFPIVKLINYFNEFITQHYSAEKNARIIPQDASLRSSKRTNFGGDFRVDNFKEIVSTSPETIRDGFLDNLFTGAGFSDEGLGRELFMSTADVHDLITRGGLIGSHTHAHRMLDITTEEVIADDLSLSQAFFRKEFDVEPTCLAYPYGRSSDAARASLAQNGFSHSVTVEQRGVRPDDDPLLLPRYDTNDIRDFLAGR